MRIFTKKEKEIERSNMIEDDELEASILEVNKLKSKTFELSNSICNKLIIFPGSVVEYEKFKGYEVEICNNGRLDKGIDFNELTKSIPPTIDRVDQAKAHISFLELLLNERIEALVNVNFITYCSPENSGPYNFVRSKTYGLPVRKK